MTAQDKLMLIHHVIKSALEVVMFGGILLGIVSVIIWRNLR